MINGLPPLPIPQPKTETDWHRQGLRNREHGKAFEDDLDKTFDYYNEKGFAQINKTPEPMKVIRSMGQGRFLACFTKKAQPDYKGTVKGGRSVMFEAKYTEKDHIDQDAVKKKQTEYMDAASDLGARCYVLVGFRSSSVYRVPWSDWKNMKRLFGHKYATEQQLLKYQVKRSWNDRLLILD